MALIAAVSGPASASTDTDSGAAAAIATQAARSTPLATAGLSESSHSRFAGAGVTDGNFTLTRTGAVRHVGRVGTSQEVFSGNNVDTVVQRTVTGGRILEVIRDSKSPTTFVYDMTLPAGSQILPDKGGSDLLIGKKTQDAQGNVTFDVQQVIAPAWAVDANGKSLPAKYTVDGTKITMSVDTTGATFPVTADPTWEKGGFRVVWSNWTTWSAAVYLNRDRTDDFMDGNTVACGVLVLVPGLGVWLTLGCVAMMWLVKTGSRIAGWCARYVVNAFSPTRPQLYWYNGGFCT